jgi:hypothetical protein
LYDKLAEISERLKAAAHLTDEPPPQIRPHTDDPETRKASNSDAKGVARKLEPEPEPPPDQLIGGVIFGTGVATSQRIDDREFHTSVQSPVTQAWRRSIEAAERAEARKRTRWIG